MKEKIGIVAIVFLKKENKFLLVENKRTGNITFPAGSAEKNETAEETLKREVLEETGLKPSEYVFKDTGMINEFIYNSFKIQGEEVKSRQKIYVLITEKKDLQPIDYEEINIKGWFSEEEVLNMLTFDDLKKIFKKAIKDNEHRKNKIRNTSVLV